MKDWIPILISFLALAFSIYATYIKDLRKKALIKFREAWDVHQTPSLSGTFLGNMFEEKNRQIFLVYTISVTNYGDKESSEIVIHAGNVPEDLKASDALVEKQPLLRCTPTLTVSQMQSHTDPIAVRAESQLADERYA